MEFYIGSHQDDKNINVINSQKFFEEFFTAFTEESINFYDQWGLFPFAYGEKQANSVVVPAIHKITKNVWLEQPFKIGNVQRFLDIATVYENNIYLIELKHSWNSKNDNIAKRTDREWETSIDQIATLRRSNVKQFVNHKDFKIFKIALMIMPTYITNNLNHKILKQSAHQYAQDIFKKYQEYRSEKYRANYVLTWKVENCKKYIHYYEGEEQFFPFISLIVKIDQIFG